MKSYRIILFQIRQHIVGVLDRDAPLHPLINVTVISKHLSLRVEFLSLTFCDIALLASQWSTMAFA